MLHMANYKTKKTREETVKKTREETVLVKPVDGWRWWIWLCASIEPQRSMKTVKSVYFLFDERQGRCLGFESLSSPSRGGQWRPITPGGRAERPHLASAPQDRAAQLSRRLSGYSESLCCIPVRHAPLGCTQDRHDR